MLLTLLFKCNSDEMYGYPLTCTFDLDVESFDTGFDLSGGVGGV